MERRNQKDEVPFSHYLAQFAAMEPQQAARRLHIPFDGEAFTLRFLGRDYRISHPDGDITPSDTWAARHLPARTFLLRWLLCGVEQAGSGAFRTFRELSWGEVYAAPFQGRALQRAAFSFAHRLTELSRGAALLGGKPLALADAAYEFPLVGSYALRLLLWQGDEDFPPNAQILFSDNFDLCFTAEDRAVAADLLLGALKAALS